MSERSYHRTTSRSNKFRIPYCTNVMQCSMADSFSIVQCRYLEIFLNGAVPSILCFRIRHAVPFSFFYLFLFNDVLNTFGAGHSSEVERSLMVQWVIGSILHGVDPMSYFSFQPELHDWCNKGCGMCYPVYGMVHI